MAVGCSREEADDFISGYKLDGGKVTVACVNSPSSVTLSGDVNALEHIKNIFDAHKIFARRLKVEIAYHSAHMNRVFGTYSASIADIELIQSHHNQDDDEKDNSQYTQIIVSSVTGQEIRPELLGPYYWVRNLVSPVLFSDAVRELVCPSEADEDTDKYSDHTHTGNSVDYLIEIGPHGDLGGPIEQILGYHGIQNVSHKSMLTRGKNALDTSLELAADMFLAGIPLQISKVNGDINTHQLIDLPPYQWNHSKIFRHETRIQRELVNRKFPTKNAERRL